VDISYTPDWSNKAVIVLDLPENTSLPIQVVKLEEVRVLRRVQGVLEEDN
jgi:hypothetical protein